MIETIYCYWCSNPATHTAQGYGDTTAPACDTCDEPEDYTPPKRPRKRAQARAQAREWIDICPRCHATAPLFEPMTHKDGCK